MKVCKDCKYNKGNWCSEYCASSASLVEIEFCTKYKKKIEKKTNNIKKKSIKQEKKLAEDLGAKKTPQSGAQDTSPSDMIVGNYIIESKATKGKSINVKEEWLSSLKYSPIHLGQIPTLVLEFPKRSRYVVLAEEDFKKIIGENNG